MPSTFTGTLAVRVGLSDFLNLELIRVGLYRVHLSCWTSCGKVGRPVSCQAAPQSLEALSRGAGCGASPVPSLVAELDDLHNACLSRSVHVRYTDEAHQLHEAYTFHIPGLPLAASDARVLVRLRLLRAEPPAAAAEGAEGAAIAAAAFAPVASRTLSLSMTTSCSGQGFFASLLFDRNHLAALGVTVHTGLVGAALAPPALPRALSAEELAAAAAAPAGPPPAWARRFLAHCAARHTLQECLSRAHHARAAQAREQGMHALLASTLALAAAEPPPSGLPAALEHFRAGLRAAAAGAAAAAAAEAEAAAGAEEAEGAGEAAGGGAGAGGAAAAEENDLCPESLSTAQEALVGSLARVERAAAEWRAEALGCRGGAAAPLHMESLAAAPPPHAGSSSALSDISLDASGVFAKPRAPRCAEAEAARLLRASARGAHSLAKAWRGAFGAFMQCPQASLEPLQRAFRAAAASAVGAACAHVRGGAPLPLEDLVRPLPPALVAPATAAEAPTSAPLPTPPPRTHDPLLDSTRLFLSTQWARYAAPTPAAPPAAAAAAAAAAATAGQHLVIFVPGLGGNSFDLRTYKAALKLHHPDLVCHTAESVCSESGGDILASGLRLAGEVAAQCAATPQLRRLSFVCFSLGGVWARCAVRAPALAPWLPSLHTFVSIASPHLGFPSDARGSTLLFGGQLLMSGWMGKKRTQALAQLALSVEVGGGAGQPPPLPLLYYLACGWPAAGAGEPLASLRAAGLASGPNGSAVLAHFKHIVLLASPQDTYSPFASALACPPPTGSSSGAPSPLHADMVRGFWEGAGGLVQRVSVHLHDLGGGVAPWEAAEGEGLAGPADAGCAQPPASLAAQAAGGLLGLFDAVSGRDAHMGMLTSEAVPQVVALGCEVWA